MSGGASCEHPSDTCSVDGDCCVAAATRRRRAACSSAAPAAQAGGGNCLAKGVACTTSGQCCGLSCVGGSCAGACTQNGTAAPATAQCCSGNCAAACARRSSPAGCTTDATPATDGTTCCSQNCQGGHLHHHAAAASRSATSVTPAPSAAAATARSRRARPRAPAWRSQPPATARWTARLPGLHTCCSRVCARRRRRRRVSASPRLPHPGRHLLQGLGLLAAPPDRTACQASSPCVIVSGGQPAGWFCSMPSAAASAIGRRRLRHQARRSVRLGTRARIAATACRPSTTAASSTRRRAALLRRLDDHLSNGYNASRLLHRHRPAVHVLVGVLQRRSLSARQHGCPALRSGCSNTTGKCTSDADCCAA